MTAYGETVTQKENSFDSYLVVPGKRKEEMLPSKDDQVVDLNEWRSISENNYVLYFDNFHFAYYSFSEPHTLKSKLKASGDFVLMQFCLDGNCSYSNELNKKNITFGPSEHNILCIPKDQKLIFSYDSNGLEVVNIYFEKEFLLKYIPKDHLVSDRISKNMLGTVVSKNLQMNAKMQSVIMDIINCEFEGHLKKLYTQAKIIELLTLQLVQFEEVPSSMQSIKKTDADKMMLVKNLIANNIEQPLSLSYLARAVGTNEQYLKKHFKMMFGSTVFNYIVSVKMEKAKHLLLEGNHKIADVAITSGYKHATHFSSAFKKYFGYLPNKIKMIWLILDPEPVITLFSCSGVYV